MKLNIFKMNMNGDKKLSRVIDTDDYYSYECGGSKGLTLFRKGRGRPLILATPEFFEVLLEDYYEHKDCDTFSYIVINGEKQRDKKGKLLRRYTREDYIDYPKKITKMNYIEVEDLVKIDRRELTNLIQVF